MSSSKAPRYVFLDVARGIAVLWMVQVHITNQVLSPELRTTDFFSWLNISNGFVAPTFIFCAGAGLWIALSRKGLEYAHYGPALFVYLRRLAYILFWAYMLHVPFYSVERMLQGSLSDLSGWLVTDVLQIIVYASLSALALFLLFARGSIVRATWIYGIVSVAFLYGSFFLRNIDTVSPFPLFPWMGYLFFGATVTGIFMLAENKRKVAHWFILLGFATPFILFTLKATPPATMYTELWWDASPGVLLFRVSATLLLLGILYVLEDVLKTSRTGKFLQLVGTESLFMYISHILVVYGSGGEFLYPLLGITYTNYGGVAIMYVLVMLPLIIMMYKWNALKTNKPELARKILAIQIVLMILFLLVTPSDFSLKNYF